MGLNGQDQSPDNIPHASESIAILEEFWCASCPVCCCW